MTLEIRYKKRSVDDILIIETETGRIIKIVQCLDEANRICWQNKNPAVRYQILTNSWSNRHELTWYTFIGDMVIPNGYASFEQARLAIVEDHLEYCIENECLEHPNPFGDFSIIDTFTEEELPFELAYHEYSHPDPQSLKS